MKGLQLPLGVQLPDTASFETYCAGPNAETVAALRAVLAPDAPPVLLLYGPPGSGKSHLLQALTR
ncbi:MAG: DnaA regulatory inactivator Hda, partial [Nevskiaceae bacterium]